MPTEKNTAHDKSIFLHRIQAHGTLSIVFIIQLGILDRIYLRQGLLE